MKTKTIISEAHGALPEIEMPLLGDSPPMMALHLAALQAAAHSSAVMIVGEPGTGKQTVARFIHEHSNRADNPFIPVDCSALNEDGLERELFGHVIGAFTGATRNALGCIRAANGGSLFLDEIDQLSLPLQEKLLRVLKHKVVTPLGCFEPRSINVRIMAATRCDLSTLIDAGKFRADFRARLSGLTLNCPPLRSRLQDVIQLAEHFLDVQAKLFDEPLKVISASAIRALQTYRWPGNVRELAELMQQAHVLASNGTIELTDLPPHMKSRLTQIAPEWSLGSSAPRRLELN